MTQILISNNKIVSAQYGILDKYIDVSNIINNFINNKNTSIITVSNITFKKDPYFRKVKELILQFDNGHQYKLKEKEKFHFKFIHNESKSDVSELENDLENDSDNNTTDSEEHDTTDDNSNSDIVNILYRKPEKHEYIVSVNARDENNLIEWATYHLMIGFDKVVIIDHLSKKPVKSIFEKYDKIKDRVEIIESDSNEPNVKLYFLNNIIIPYMKKNNVKYFIHLDADEYINLNDNFNTIQELINNYNNPKILYLNWVFFGSNLKKVNDNKYKCVLPTYPKCNSSVHYYYKCIIQVSDELDKFTNPHHVYFKNTENYICINNDIYPSNNIKNKNSDYGNMRPNYKTLKDVPAFINHYSCQSLEDYKKRKCNRKRDDCPKTREFSDGEFKNNNNIVYDNLSKKYYNTIKLFIENKI